MAWSSEPSSALTSSSPFDFDFDWLATSPPAQSPDYSTPATSAGSPRSLGQSPSFLVKLWRASHSGSG